MASISQIKLPNNTTYNIKDSVSGYTTNTGTVTKISTGTGLTGGDITTSGTISLAAHSADLLSGGYVNIQPENTPTIIPFMNNDIAFLTKRGGSVTITYDGTEQSIDLSGCFDGTPGYGYGIGNSGSYTSIVIVMNLHKTFTWGNTFYVDFGASGWRAKGIKVEVMNSSYSGDTWTQKYNNTNNTAGHIYCGVAHQPVGATNTGGGFNKIRVTFTTFNNAIFRIAQLGLYNYSSNGLAETYLNKAGGAIYNGDIYPYTNNTGNIGQTNHYWKGGYFTFINGAEVGSSPKFTDTTYSSKAASSGGTDVSLCTTGEKYTWNNKSNLTLGTTSTTALKGDTKYAGASTAGGSATSAAKLDTATAGSTTQPCYFVNGVPSACTYTLSKSVPSDAKFTDTTYESKAAASGGTAVSLCTTGEKYNWNTSPRMTTNTYPTLFNQDGNSSWIRIGTDSSYGILPPNSGGAGSGKGHVGASNWYWEDIFVDKVNSKSVVRRDDWWASNDTTKNIDNLRGATTFVYTTHGAPATGTAVAFDCGTNENYTLQLCGSYTQSRMFFRNRFGDNPASWFAWTEACQRYEYPAVSTGSSATLYIPLSMRGNKQGYNCAYLLSCPTSTGDGSVWILQPDTYSTQKMLITQIVAGRGLCRQTSDPWGFIVTAGINTIPSIIRL